MPQIRVLVGKRNYEELKSKAKDCGLDMNKYASLVLNGYSLVKNDNPVIKPSNTDVKE
jgi:phage pi2 protein 07